MFTKNNIPAILITTIIVALFIIMGIEYVALTMEYGFWFSTTSYGAGIILSAIIIYHIRKND